MSSRVHQLAQNYQDVLILSPDDRRRPVKPSSKQMGIDLITSLHHLMELEQHHSTQSSKVQDKENQVNISDYKTKMKSMLKTLVAKIEENLEYQLYLEDEVQQLTEKAHENDKALQALIEERKILLQEREENEQKNKLRDQELEKVQRWCAELNGRIVKLNRNFRSSLGGNGLELSPASKSSPSKGHKSNVSSNSDPVSTAGSASSFKKDAIDR